MTLGASRTTWGVTRRHILAGTGAALLLSTTGCELLSTDPAKDEDGADQGPRKGKEPPALANQVESGRLPRLEQRLPREPMIVEPAESVGNYGGTWRSWMQAAGAVYMFTTQIGYENLVRWDVEWTEVLPNIAESWEIRGDGKEYIFHLRNGMKWSDGEPLKADDFIFTYDDVLLNKDLYPTPPDLFTVQRATASVEKIDDHTFKFDFPIPNGLFLEKLATPHGNVLPVPRHYLEQFHKEFSSDVEQLAEDEGFDSWADLFLGKMDWRSQNKDLPVLYAWIPTNLPGEGTAGAEFERNPYFWKSDPDGNQLPYLDTVSYELIQDLEVALLKTVNGEIDLNVPRAAASVVTPENKPVLARNREQGKYHFFDGTTSLMNEMVVMVNLVHENQALREVFQSRDFRIGLSHAINREELVNAVFQRQGEPWQAAPRPESEFYDEQFAKQYTGHDIETANEYLDRAGYTQRDDEGFRIRSDGERISFSVDVVTEEPDQISALELIQGYWESVGIDLQVRNMDRTLYNERKQANQYDATVWTGGGGLKDEILYGFYYLPFHAGSRYALAWANWYLSEGEDGEEPPEAARRQMQLYDELSTTSDNERQHELFKQIIDIAKEQFWAIGTVLPGDQYGTVRSNLHNTPERMPTAYLYSVEGPTLPEQYYKSGRQ